MEEYADRLKDLKIYSLERRREHFFILHNYRVLIGLISLNGSTSMRKGALISSASTTRMPPLTYTQVSVFRKDKRIPCSYVYFRVIRDYGQANYNLEQACMDIKQPSEACRDLDEI